MLRFPRSVLQQRRACLRREQLVDVVVELAVYRVQHCGGGVLRDGRRQSCSLSISMRATMECSTSFVEKTAVFASGFLVMVGLQAVYGWWLNAGTDVLRTVLVLSAAGALAAFWRSGHPWVRARCLWAGAIAGTTAVLFWTGPGTIWPIVLAMAAAITAGAVFGGALIAVAAHKLRP